MLLNNIPT